MANRAGLIALETRDREESFRMRLSAAQIGRTAHGAAGLVLLPLLQGAEEILIGGQAVIEGVMMRSPHSYAVAVRRASGDVAVTRGSLERASEKYPWLRYPLVRGLSVLGQAMALGIRALRYSAEQALERPSGSGKGGSRGGEEKKSELSNWVLALNLAFFILFYKFLPLYLATVLKRHYAVFENLIAFNVGDGMIRMVLFLAFLIAVAQWKEMKRLFEYHGAEHKVVWAFEKAGRVDLETARASTRFHPRCGTSFLLVVMVIAMVIYLFLPFSSFVWKLAGRILL